MNSLSQLDSTIPKTRPNMEIAPEAAPSIDGDKENGGVSGSSVKAASYSASNSSLSPRGLKGSVEARRYEEEEEEEEEAEEAEPGPIQPKPAPQPKSKLAGKRAPSLPESEEEAVDESSQLGSREKDKDKQLSDEEQEGEDESGAEEPARRIAKRAPKASKPSAATRTKPKPRPPKDTDEYEHEPTTFPVVVHRLAKGDAGTKLPAGSQRAGVNPVDVVSQVATELIDRFYQRLKSGAEKKAVESFKEELCLRLLELVNSFLHYTNLRLANITKQTDALEHSITLTDRVRKAQRRKNQLMAELLAIKRERTQVAVQMDDVRRDHEIASKSSEVFAPPPPVTPQRT